MPDQPDEAKELRLVNNVELKIALAETEDKLQRLLKLYLPPLLLKLGSPHVSVRNKVIAVCQHVNTRTKPSTLLLPVDALLSQFKDPLVGGCNPLIRNFDLMYIQTGFERLPVSDRVGLLPPLLKDISAHDNVTHQQSLFNILLKLLPHFTPPPRGTAEDTALRVTLGFDKNPKDAEWLASWFKKLMLLNLSVFTPIAQTPDTQVTPQRESCPGLSPEDFNFLTLGGKRETFLPYSVLTDIKKAVLIFLASGAFTDTERYFPTLISSLDSNSAVSGPAEDIFKRVSPSISLDDEAIVSELYSLYFGTPPGIGPVKVILQAKIVALLAKSQFAVSGKWKSQIMEIVESGLETEYSKLRGAVFGFITWASRMAGDEVMQEISGTLVEKLRYWILSDDSSNGGAGGDELRGYAYDSLGLIAKRSPSLVLEPQLGLLRFLFRQLRDEPVGAVAVSVEGALATLLPTVAQAELERDVEEGLEELLLQEMVKETDGVGGKRSTRWSAVRYAVRGLRFGNVVGRWVCLLAIGKKEERGEVVEEAKKGLHPYYYELLNPEEMHQISVDHDAMDVDQTSSRKKYALPLFSSVMDFFFNPQIHDTTTWSNSREKLVAGIMPPEVFSTALGFARRIVAMEALSGEVVQVDEDWERKLDAAVETDKSVRTRFKEYLCKQGNPVEVLLKIAWEGMVFDNTGIEGVRGAWVELVGLLPGDFWGREFAGRVKELMPVFWGNKLEARTTAAHALGLLITSPHVEKEALEKMVWELIRTANTWEKGSGGNESNRIHGSILALGYILSRLSLRNRGASLDKEPSKQAIEVILKPLLNSKDQMIIEAAITAFGQICIFGVISSSDFSGESSAEHIQAKLVELSKKGKEKAILALGYLSLTFPHVSGDKEVQKILDSLYSLHENRQVEINFTTGEAIAAVAGGWGSVAIKRNVDLDDADIDLSIMEGLEKHQDARMKNVVERVMDSTKDTKPALKKAVCVWMLSLLEFCGQSPEIEGRLGEMQKGFRGFLADRDEFVQETAARGLTMVYERGDKETKDDLVRNLISSFTGEKRTLTGNVSADTELFEPGALPTGDGSISTYKDIMSLASEVGDPSLVYKFMTLARHNTLWSSRAAFGRFGLGSILSSSEILAENPKLYPKLYRYRFDPNPNVAKSMTDIWNSLVKDSTGTVEKWFDAIMEDLLVTILDRREWRTREASCNALSELVQGRPLAKYTKYLERIWSVAFKVLDDLKESVRTAAMKLCRVLTASMIRNVDVNAGSSPKDAAAVLESLMPFLTGSSGLEAEAKDVQVFSLRTLLQLINTAGKTLLPFVPDLVDKLTGLLSSLEPEVINYLHLNASKYNTTGEDIDRIRLSQVRGSPMMNAIEKCLDLLDEGSMAELIPRLQKSIKKALGLPSKIGCSRIIITLVMRHGILAKPYADDLLKSVRAALLDRSEAVSSSYAGAAGYLCRLATDEKILDLVKYSQKLYFEGEDEKSRALSGETVYAICKHASDRFNALAVDILPFIFVGKHDPEKSVNEDFAKAWSENTGGAGAIKLYLKEIVDLVKTHLTSQRWAIKQTAALSLADACKSIGGDLSPHQLNILWPVLVSATGGKSWDGKEAVLDALVSLSINGNDHFKSDEGRLTELTKIILRESKRNNPSYRSSALKSLGDFIDNFEGLNLFEPIYGVVESAISSDDDIMDVDAADGRSAKLVQQTTVINGLAALSQAFRPKSHIAPANTKAELMLMLKLLDDKMAGENYEVKTCGIECISRIIGRLSTASISPDGDVILRLWTRIQDPARDRGNENLRLKAATAIVGLIELGGQGPSDGLSSVWDKIRGELGELLKEEHSSVVLQRLEPAAVRFL